MCVITSCVSLFLGCVVLALIRYTLTISIPSIQDIVGMVEGTAENILINTSEMFQDPVTRALCNLRTDELISYYGYKAEEHTVTTEDGYILTVFRCNSMKNVTNVNKKVVIVQHGLLGSSDEFCVSDPSKGLAYVFADAGFDVWLSNARGNLYSRRHQSKNPNDSSSGFWHFSWYELAIYDYPAVIDYVRDETNNSKVFIIGHSQGTTTLMTLLSEKTEYNQKVAAASLITPVGYLNNSDSLLHIVSKVLLQLPMFADFEFLPRNFIGSFPETFCLFDPMDFCGLFQNFLFGPSEDQRNDTLLATFFCHIPSGASVNQLIHYSQELQYGFFGRFMEDENIPSNFELSKITTPLILHYSPLDRFTNQADIDRLIPQLNNSLIYVQRVDEFNHIDFVMGNDAANIVFPEILQFFNMDAS